MAAHREAIVALANGKLSLEQALKLVAALYPDRIVILPSAFESARESDRGGFRYGTKALQLLLSLAGEYWERLAAGRGDQQARAVFGGKDFAAKEASSLSNDGKRRRTFSHNGADLFMEKHLKYGVKDSLAETLRIHFAWLPDTEELVIGHCGKHLAL